MKSMKELLFFTVLSILVITSAWLNLGATIQLFLALFSVAVLGYVMGIRWMPSHGRWIASVWGTLGVLAVLMIIRSLWFYADFTLDNLGSAWCMALTVLFGMLWIVFDRRTFDSESMQKESMSIRDRMIATASIGVSVIGFLLIVRAAYTSGTTTSILTPWPFMPKWTLPLIGFLWAWAVIIAWKLNRASVTVVQVVCALGATTLLTVVLYKLGYGFDGFLHIAGEQILQLTGSLNPKPPYYMGQYVFVTWISTLFEIAVADVDRWLVPIASATLVPFAMFATSQKMKTAATMMLAIILVPIAAFVATTPHGFATVLGVVALLLCINVQTSGMNRALPMLFAVWSALTHPLVGLPIFFATVMAVVHSTGWKAIIRIPLSWLFALVSGISIPIVFGFATYAGSQAGVSFDIHAMFDAGKWIGLLQSWTPWVPNRYAMWPSASVWVEKLLPWIAMLFAVTAVIRSKKEKKHHAPWIVAATSAALAALVLTLAGDFHFLIDYERGNYADRLWSVAWILLLPLAIPELGYWLNRARKGAILSKMSVLIAVGLLGAGASYAALPRHDAVTASRGWSVGASDIEAVKLIEEDADGAAYTVLANQSVSAAAVRELGFKRYKNDVFFYPIPTGGKLYELFLSASYDDPSQETMLLAGKLGGSNLVYFVVNDYWWKADELIEQAKASANREFVIADGAVHVFRYDLLNPVMMPTMESE